MTFNSHSNITGYIAKRKEDMDRAQKEYDAYVEDRFRQKTASILPEEERQVRYLRNSYP